MNQFIRRIGLSGLDELQSEGRMFNHQKQPCASHWLTGGEKQIPVVIRLVLVCALNKEHKNRNGVCVSCSSVWRIDGDLETLPTLNKQYC